MKYCPKCGSKIGDKWKFCPECDFDLSIVESIKKGTPIKEMVESKPNQKIELSVEPTRNYDYSKSVKKQSSKLLKIKESKEKLHDELIKLNKKMEIPEAEVKKNLISINDIIVNFMQKEVKILIPLFIIILFIVFYLYGINNSLRSELTQGLQKMALSNQSSEKCSTQLNALQTGLNNCQQSSRSSVDTKTQYKNDISNCENSIRTVNSTLASCISQSNLNKQNSQTCSAKLGVYSGCT